MSRVQDVIQAFNSWYASLKGMRKYSGRPAKGIVAAALVVLERLRTTIGMQLADHLAEGGAQIAGLNLVALRKILLRFGESRPFPSEGGRTNRGNNRPIENLLLVLKLAGFETLNENERNSAVDAIQQSLVEALAEYYQLEPLRFDYDARVTVRELIRRILESAENRTQAGPVAQHLVGAKLATRFPDRDIANYPYSAADDPAGRAGDFEIGGTAIHVTVVPTLRHAQRCAKNIADGLWSLLLAPDAKLDRGRVFVEEVGLNDRIAVESLESFVAQNILEIGEFAPDGASRTLGELLRTYNDRVRGVETDESLLIEIPASLK